MTTIRPEAIRFIRDLGNRRVDLGAVIILTSDSGIESQYSRDHSHDVHVAFGPQKPGRENDELSWQESGGWSLLGWQRSIEQGQQGRSLEKVEYSRHYCQPDSSPMFDKFACGYTTTLSVYVMHIIVKSLGRRHGWNLTVEHKSPSEMEEIRINYEKYGDRTKA